MLYPCQLIIIFVFDFYRFESKKLHYMNEANCKSLKWTPSPPPPASLPGLAPRSRAGREAGRAREGNTPLHPSQEGIYPRPWWPMARSQRLKEEQGKGEGVMDFCKSLNGIKF
jgi:hypothetical protein